MYYHTVFCCIKISHFCGHVLPFRIKGALCAGGEEREDGAAECLVLVRATLGFTLL